LKRIITMTALAVLLTACNPKPAAPVAGAS
jgi:hypothetical protein